MTWTNIRKRIIWTTLSLTLISFGTAQLTLETGEIGEIFFTWQGELDDARATAHRLSRMDAFRYAFDDGLISSLEILEITELNTNQRLAFNYVLLRSDAPPVPGLSDVIWYYPNPIPAGGEVRLLVRGRIESTAVFRGDAERIEFAFRSSDEVLFVLPTGYAVTYSSNPIIVYEKDARTVASFPRTSSPIALIAKDARTLDAGAAPIISREANAIETESALDLEVGPVDDEAVLAYARDRVNRGITEPVMLVDLEDPFSVREQDRPYMIPGRTVIWSVNDVIVSGTDDFARLEEMLAIGFEANLGIIMINEEGNPSGSRTIRMTATSVR